MIAIGCDHGGYELKQDVINYFVENHIEYKDFGCYGVWTGSREGGCVRGI